MGLFNKIVDLFTDETEEEVTKEIEIEEKEEHQLPTFMRNKIEKEQEEKKILMEEPKKEEKFSDRELVQPNNKFAFPINFDESDFVDPSRLKRKNILEEEKKKEIPVKKIYEKKEVEPPKRFKPTPIVSPVYGVLEKNYNKEDVLEKSEDQYEIQRPSKKVDFEAVRRKAFGNLSDDIRDNLCDNCEYLKEVRRVQKMAEDNLLSDMLLEDQTIATAEENYYDFGVEYEQPKKKEVSEVNIEEVNVNINPEIRITDHNIEEVEAEKIEVKEEKNIKDSYEEDLELITEEEVPTRTKKEEEIDLTDDLFSLIDSMYDEKED